MSHFLNLTGQPTRRTNKVGVEDLTVDKGLFKSFDEIVRRQLDPIWHTLGKKTKQLVADLRTLRKLLDYLLRYDAVTYLKYLDTLRVSEGVRSVWILADSSHKIFELAKRRVYQVIRPDGTKVSTVTKGTPTKKRKVTHGSSKKGKETENEDSTPSKDDAQKVNALEEVLEEAPKWKVLRELLKEIAEEQRKGDGIVHEDESSESGIVLVACKDERSCLQLQECISKSPQQVMREEWEKYLLGKAELHGLHKKKKRQSQQPKGFGVLDGEFPAGPSENAGPVSIRNLETDALLAAASGISNLTKEADAMDDSVASCRSGSVKGKGKGVSRKVPKRKASNRKTNNAAENESCQGTDVEASGKIDEQSEIDVSKVSAKDASGPSSTAHNAEDLIDAKMLPPVQFYALDSDQHVLDTWKPSVIIVYHPDITFVREIESGRCIGPTLANEPEPILSQNSVTRNAGGRKPTEKEMQVIVDMREFMSSLPNVLHQKGIRIIPVTLEVGDYVLSPLICVERKSISDLFQSFASGRLYNQVETMISLHATASIFMSLKTNQDEPDETKAMRVGVPSEDGVVGDDVRAENYNTSAIEFLRRLPGVTDSNYRAMMDGCDSLADLALLPVERLAELMGSQKGVRTLKEFLDAKCPSMIS
ncbi:hypothetical protein ACQ4PT_028499 [Festuca glaucescens]